MFHLQRSCSGSKIFDFVSDQIKLSSVLEVGCESGWNLCIFKDYGFNTIGLDSYPVLLKQANEYGINIKNGSIFDNTSSKIYDLIFFIMCLNIFKILSILIFKLKSLLNADVLIYIEVPSLESIFSGDFNCDLLYYF